MLDIKKIVVPVDLNKNTQKLVDYALTIAKPFDAEVALFHAVEFMTMGEMALGNPNYDDMNTTHKNNAQKTLSEIVTKASTKCRKCTSEVVIGDIVDEILAYTKREDGNMIIIGTHGKRGFERILLGSVAERVLKNAHCPVLVMNPYK